MKHPTGHSQLLHCIKVLRVCILCTGACSQTRTYTVIRQASHRNAAAWQTLHNNNTMSEVFHNDVPHQLDISSHPEKWSIPATHRQTINFPHVTYSITCYITQVQHVQTINSFITSHKHGTVRVSEEFSGVRWSSSFSRVRTCLICHPVGQLLWKSHPNNVSYRKSDSGLDLHRIYNVFGKSTVVCNWLFQVITNYHRRHLGRVSELWRNTVASICTHTRFTDNRHCSIHM